MNAANIMTVITSLLGSGVVIAVLQYLQNRRKSSAEGQVAEGTARAQIGIVTVQELESRLGFLNKIIVALEAANIRLEASSLKIENENEELFIMNSQLKDRVAELARKCEQYESLLRRICRENGIDPDLYMKD